MSFIICITYIDQHEKYVCVSQFCCLFFKLKCLENNSAICFSRMQKCKREKRVQVLNGFLMCFEQTFFNNLITCDEIWVHQEP